MAQSQDGRQASWSEVVVVCLALLAALGVEGLVVLLFPHLKTDSWVLGVALEVVAYALIATVVVVALHRIPETVRSMLGAAAAPVTRQALVAVASAAGAFLLVVGVPCLFGVPLTDITGTSNGSVAKLIVDVAFFLIVVGPIEELCFRGYLFGRLRQLVRPSFAVVIQAVLFGLWHIPTHPNLASIGLVTVVGLLFGFVRWKVPAATILALGVAHGLYDATLAVLAAVV